MPSNSYLRRPSTSLAWVSSMPCSHIAYHGHFVQRVQRLAVSLRILLVWILDLLVFVFVAALASSFYLRRPYTSLLSVVLHCDICFESISPFVANDRNISSITGEESENDDTGIVSQPKQLEQVRDVVHSDSDDESQHTGSSSDESLLTSDDEENLKDIEKRGTSNFPLLL